MCGIAGFCDFNKKSDKNILHNMTDILHHRGPDDSGYSFFATENVNIGLGHRRLSILDLSSHGHQPMQLEHLEIVFNGEVYNFKEIREELKKFHYSFESESDTEVILKAYHKWGIKAVEKFNGMFAIAIYDKENEKLILIRDRAGVKPVYYYYSNNIFLFASELKSFHQNPNFYKSINKDSLALYLQHGFIPEPHSIFIDTYKLSAGNFLELDLKSRDLKVTKYWNLVDFYNNPKLDISYEDAIKTTEEIMISSFNYRMVSDVPVGVFLSGGYDSSAVAAILQTTNKQKINTFTIGFNEAKYDESKYAKEVANHLGTNHTEYYCTQKDALDIIEQLPYIYDEPFGDSSAIPTILVSQLAKSSVSVSLSADGGDEIFGGYSKYKTTLKYYSLLQNQPRFLKKSIAVLMEQVKYKHIPIYCDKYESEIKYSRLKEMLNSNITPVELMSLISQKFTHEMLNSILIDKFKISDTNYQNKMTNSLDFNSLLYADYRTYMVDDILTKVDRATMSVSLEGREPLLDYRIIEFVAQLPLEYKMDLNNSKKLLKDIVHKYIPKNIMDRKKMGFSVPIAEWFKDELKEYFNIYLSKERIDREGLLNSNEVIRLKNDYFRGKKVNIQRLWFILMFEMWYEKWM